MTRLSIVATAVAAVAVAVSATPAAASEICETPTAGFVEGYTIVSLKQSGLGCHGAREALKAYLHNGGLDSYNCTKQPSHDNVNNVSLNCSKKHHYGIKFHSEYRPH